jgi:hypothetical protein
LRKGSDVHVTVQEIAFFSILYAITVAASISRGLRDAEYRNNWHCLSSGFTSGFFSLGIITVWINSDPSNTSGNAWYYIGIAVLLGLAGKEQDTILRFILSGIAKGFRIVIDEKTK